MEHLFNMISSSARIDKSKKKRKLRTTNDPSTSMTLSAQSTTAIDSSRPHENAVLSRDRTGKRDTSQKRLDQLHKEKIAAFRKSMNIRIANKEDANNIIDPITTFTEINVPSWWKVPQAATEAPTTNKNSEASSFASTLRALLRNIEAGKWKEPTPIQMQAIPTLVDRRDVIGAAPTGSGKSGAFLLPALLIASASHQEFYGTTTQEKKSKQGIIRVLILAPSMELASQLHRETERLGTGKPGGVSTLLLTASNATNVSSGTAGGKRGVDVLIATPLRLVDLIQKKGLRLNGIRMVVLDEADRLLDASDTSATSHSFLSQMDCILGQVPSTAVRALFSATVTPLVRTLSESILRDPLDLTVGRHAGAAAAANTDIDQQLLFVGREEGKLLAIRQLVQRGDLQPPAIIFLQSQERAQALFGELLYDNIHVDVLHAGRSRSARETAVAEFRKGDTWVLICTDVVARGVDFRAVNVVINYDVPVSAVTYVHRIGRTGRAGRAGKAITLFTEADLDHIRPIANVVKQSGCHVPEWMLTSLSYRQHRGKDRHIPKKRAPIDTTPSYDKKKRRQKRQMIEHSREQKKEKHNDDSDKAASDTTARPREEQT